MINLAYLIFFVPTEGPVRMINLAYLIFFWGRQKAQCERSTLPALIFFWTDRRPNVNNEPCIFLTINLACFFKQSTLHVFLHNQPCMFFNNQPCMFLFNQTTMHVFLQSTTTTPVFLGQHEGRMSTINLARFFS
jgi:hypothetical protein